MQGLVSTARRGGVPFVRTRRRGLRSMSGHPAYAWGNPPTLRRSSFPQRASRPAGGPIPKHAWGCAPRPPNAKLRLDTNWTFQQMLKSRSVQRRRYALKVPAAHYMWGNCKSAAESYHRKACASLSNEGNELKNFPHSRSVNVEDCGEYIAGFGFQCYRLTSFLSVRPSR